MGWARKVPIPRTPSLSCFLFLALVTGGVLGGVLGGILGEVPPPDLCLLPKFSSLTLCSEQRSIHGPISKAVESGEMIWSVKYCHKSIKPKFSPAEPT